MRQAGLGRVDWKFDDPGTATQRKMFATALNYILTSIINRLNRWQGTNSCAPSVKAPHAQRLPSWIQEKRAKSWDLSSKMTTHRFLLHSIVLIFAKYIFPSRHFTKTTSPVLWGKCCPSLTLLADMAKTRMVSRWNFNKTPLPDVWTQQRLQTLTHCNYKVLFVSRGPGGDLTQKIIQVHASF